MFAQQPVHRGLQAQVAALVQQDRVNLARRQVHEPRLVRTSMTRWRSALDKARGCALGSRSALSSSHSSGKPPSALQGTPWWRARAVPAVVVDRGRPTAAQGSVILAGEREPPAAADRRCRRPDRAGPQRARHRPARSFDPARLAQLQTWPIAPTFSTSTARSRGSSSRSGLGRTTTRSYLWFTQRFGDRFSYLDRLPAPRGWDGSSTSSSRLWRGPSAGWRSRSTSSHQPGVTRLPPGARLRRGGPTGRAGPRRQPHGQGALIRTGQGGSVHGSRAELAARMPGRPPPRAGALRVRRRR